MYGIVPNPGYRDCQLMSYYVLWAKRNYGQWIWFKHIVFTDILHIQQKGLGNGEALPSPNIVLHCTKDMHTHIYP